MEFKLNTIIGFLTLLLFISCASEVAPTPKDNPEKAAIEQTIEMYFDGWLTGDTTKIGTAMHSTCQLKNIKDDGVVIYDRAKYLSFFKPRPKLENAGGKILDIDITGPIASAKVELETAERLFTDYFNMMKVNGQWYIVDKVSTNVQKENTK